MTATELLERGEVELLGRMPWSSNHTFLVAVRDGDECTRAVYKPERGERPLWDFPRGLHRREAAAWALSEALGWGIVPATVVRDGPLGEGSVQWFVDADFDQHYFTLLEAGTHLDDLRAICAFDVIANNTDRKSGHCLLGTDGRVYAIDNSLCFHTEPKLRTVIWEFGGEPLPTGLVDAVARFATDPPAALSALLAPDEVDAAVRRAEALARRGRFPEAKAGYRHYPWPLV